MSARTPDGPAGPRRPARPRWAAAGAMLGLLAAATLAPVALRAAVPPRPADRIGVFERVVLPATADHGQVLGAVIAPAGWSRTGDRRTEIFTAPGGAAGIVVSLRVDVADPEALIRETLPLGAQALPVEALGTGSRLSVHAVEYDLAAGDAPQLSIALCTRTVPADCLRVLASFGASDAGAAGPGGAAGAAEAQDRARTELLRMLDSAEVVR